MYARGVPLYTMTQSFWPVDISQSNLKASFDDTRHPAAVALNI